MKPPRRGVSQVDRADRGSTIDAAPAVAIANSANAGSSVIKSVENASGVDVVEEALAYAIKRAVDGGLWEQVGALLRELEARRTPRPMDSAIDLAAERAKRR